LDDIRLTINREVNPVLASEKVITELLDEFYGEE